MRWDDPLPGISTPLRRAQTRNAVETAVVLRTPIGAFTRRKICRNGGGGGAFVRDLCSAIPIASGKGRSRAVPVFLCWMEILPAPALELCIVHVPITYARHSCG